MNKFFTLLLVFFIVSCNSDDVDFPDCLQESIDQARNSNPTTPRATIEKYMFNGQIVYEINLQNGFADGMTSIVDTDCNLVCNVGGIGGLTCEGFEQAEFIGTVWEDSR